MQVFVHVPMLENNVAHLQAVHKMLWFNVVKHESLHAILEVCGILESVGLGQATKQGRPRLTCTQVLL